MEKFLLAFVFALFVIGAKAQDDIDLSSEPFDYKKVLDFSSPKEQKHLQAKEWVAKTFGDYKSVLQFEDDNNCKIIIKGRFGLPSETSRSKYMVSTHEYSAQFTLTIDSKDEKYRIIFDNFSIEENFTYRLLGGRPNITTKNLTMKEYCIFDTLSQISTIEKNRANLDSLQSIDIQSLKRKQRKEHEDQIENVKSQLAFSLEYYTNHTIRCDAIKRSLQNMLVSIREAVEKKDDF